MPEELTLIISAADYVHPAEKHTGTYSTSNSDAGGFKDLVLKGRVAVTVLEKTSVEKFIDRFQAIKDFSETRTSIVIAKFGYDGYLYDCVCDQSVLDELTLGRKCTVIIMPNIAERFAFESGNISVVRIGKGLGRSS